MTMKLNLILLFIFFALSNLSAQEEIIITSDDLMINMGKEVFVDGKKVGRAPCEIKLPYEKSVLVEDAPIGVTSRRKLTIMFTKEQKTKDSWTDKENLCKIFPDYTCTTQEAESKILYSAIEEARKKSTLEFYKQNPDRASFNFYYDGKTLVDSLSLIKQGIPAKKISEIKWRIQQNPTSSFEMSSKAPAMIDLLAVYIFKPKKKFEITIIGGLLKKA